MYVWCVYCVYTCITGVHRCICGNKGGIKGVYYDGFTHRAHRDAPRVGELPAHCQLLCEKPKPRVLHFYISRKKEERDEYSIIYISHGSYVWCQLLCEKPHIRRRY